MFTNSVSAIKNVCLSVLLTSIFCTALFFSQTVPASAQAGTSLSELQAQIATLMARITALQGGGASSPATGSGGGGSSSIRSYTLADVTSVTKQFVDPNKAIADEEYNLYVITLKTGQKIEVKVAVRTVPGTAEEAFRKTGFVGSASELMSRATSSEETFKVTVSKFTATVSFTLSNGCGGYIISWGDGAKTELAGYAAGRACTMAIVNVTKNHTYAKAGTYTVKVERFNGQTLRDTSTKEIKVSSEAGTSYTLADVSKITKQLIDPIKAAADDEYNLYVITLKTGQKIEVKVPVRITSSMAEEIFRKTGFVGSVSELMSRATSNTPRIESLISTTSTSYVATVILGRPAQNVIRMGPIDLGTISWGDGVTERIIALVTGDEMVVTRNHTYKKSGTYTVLVRDTTGKTASQKVVVSGSGSSSAASSTAPQRNKFGCDRSVATKMASGSVACYGMWDYGNDFGGDVKMCGDYAAGKTGCVITTPVCTTGVAKATKYIGNSSLTTLNLGVISQRLGVSQAVSKAGIAGLWEYTCIAPAGGVSTPRVLGASTDIFSEISRTLSSIERILRDVK